MRKVFAVAMMVVAGSFAMPVGVFAAVAQSEKLKRPTRLQPPRTGGLEGEATDAAKRKLPQTRVQVRSVNPSPGQGLAATGTTDAAGT